MQIYNIMPAADGSWKAVLVSDEQLVISNDHKDLLIRTMIKWAEKVGDAITLRIFSMEGELEEEQVFPASE